MPIAKRPTPQRRRRDVDGVCGFLINERARRDNNILAHCHVAGSYGQRVCKTPTLGLRRLSIGTSSYSQPGGLRSSVVNAGEIIIVESNGLTNKDASASCLFIIAAVRICGKYAFRVAVYDRQTVKIITMEGNNSSTR